MIENTFDYKIQYSDTDAYGVCWHGAYLRIMEMGRVELLLDYGLRVEKLQMEEDIVMPVIEVDIKYKTSAKLMDEVVLKTKFIEITKTTVTFLQELFLKENGKLLTTATVKAVALKEGKIMRNLNELFEGNLEHV